MEKIKGQNPVKGITIPVGVWLKCIVDTVKIKQENSVSIRWIWYVHKSIMQSTSTRYGYGMLLEVPLLHSSQYSVLPTFASSQSCPSYEARH